MAQAKPGPAGGAQHELRILLGVQAGARLSLADGRYVLGAADTADVLVAGPGIAAEHAALTVAGARVRLQALGGALRDAQGRAIDGETDLAPGAAVALGQTWITVDRPAAAWPQPLEWLERETAPSAAGPAAASPAETAPKTPAPTTSAAPSASTAAPPRTPQRPRKDSRAVPVLLVFVVLVIGAAILVALLASQSPVTPPQAAAPPPADGARAAESAALEAAIAGLGPRAAAAVQRMGSAWIVSGNVAGEQDRTALGEAVRASSVRAALRVVTNDEVMTAAAPVIARAGLPVRGEMTGTGVVRLVGAAASRDDVERLGRTLREEVPGIREVENQVLLPDQLYERLREGVRRAGLAGVVDVRREASGRREVVFSGTPTPKEIERWEDVVRDFVTRHGMVLPIKASFKPRIPTVPFVIRTVAGGPTPHIVTGTGVKVFEGGTVAGYRLVAVRDDEIVLQGQEELRIPRERIADGRADPVSR